METFLPVVFVVTTWWLATVLMLYRSTRAREKCRATLLGSSLLALGGLVGLILTRSSEATESAYIAFLSGLALWGWHEMTYFLGYITGPRPAPCPENIPRAKRFVYGVKASLHHEVAIIVTAIVLVLLTWGQPNQVGAWTFMILWLMRWSAKLNIFLGVRNLHPEFWPDHLQYLGTYVQQARMNWLFPFSMTVTAAVLGMLIHHVQTLSPGSFGQVSLMLLITLLALAALEHVFLMIKVPDAWLWRMATGRPDGTAETDAAVSAPVQRTRKLAAGELSLTQGP